MILFLSAYEMVKEALVTQGDHFLVPPLNHHIFKDYSTFPILSHKMCVFIHCV